MTELSRSSTTSLVVGLPIDKIWMYAGLVLLPLFQPESLLSAVLMSVWSVLNNSVTAEICLKVSPTTPGDCEKVVVIRVFHKLHFAKKKDAIPVCTPHGCI